MQSFFDNSQKPIYYSNVNNSNPKKGSHSRSDYTMDLMSDTEAKTQMNSSTTAGKTVNKNSVHVIAPQTKTSQKLLRSTLAQLLRPEKTQFQALGDFVVIRRANINRSTGTSHIGTRNTDKFDIQ